MHHGLLNEHGIVLRLFYTGSLEALGDDNALYFLHANHLGSTGVVSDANDSIHQSLEYFADGETWIDRAPSMPINGYLFAEYLV